MKFFNNTRFAALGIAAALGAASGAQAHNVNDTIFTGSTNPNAGGFDQYTTVYQGSYLDTTSAAVQNSTLVTERRVTTVATEAQANMVLSQISDRLEHGTAPAGSSVSLLPVSGGNAGSSAHQGSLWARAGIDNMKEDSITNFGGWKANLWTLALGYDYKVNDKVLVGAAFTYSNLNGSTAFNKGNLRDNAYGVVPYVAFKVNPCFDIDLIAGYSRVNKSRDRTTPTLTSRTGGLTGVKATSSPKSDRYFAALFANFKQQINRWNLLARLGYTYMTDRQKSYTEANGQVVMPTLPNTSATIQSRTYGGMGTNLNRLSLRLQAGYKATHAVEPYAFLTYARDFSATKINVPDAAGTLVQGNGARGTVSYISPNAQRNNNTFGGGLGLNANLAPNWTGGLEGTYSQSKKFKVMGGMARVRMVF